MSLYRSDLFETTVRLWAEIPGEYYRRHPDDPPGAKPILRRHFEVTVYGPRFEGLGNDGRLTGSSLNWSAYGSTDLPRSYLFLRVLKKALAIAAKLQREATE
jgi:hypothetical protein